MLRRYNMLYVGIVITLVFLSMCGIESTLKEILRIMKERYY